MNGHLVTVEVRIVRCTDERMHLNGLPFNQYGLEGLNRKAVQRRGAVEHNRVAFGHLIQNVPHDFFFAFDHLLGAANGVHNAALFEFADNKGFEQHQCHFLRQTALIQFQIRADDNDGTSGVVHALAEQVLAEPALLAFEHIAQRLERTVARAADGAAVTAVVEQRVNSLLEHPFFVADDYFRRFERQQRFQTVVAVDHAAVEVVQVGRCKTSAFERNQRAQIRRNHRQHFKNHPFRARVALDQPFEHLHLADQLLAGLLAAGAGERIFEFTQLLGQIDLLEQLADPFCTDTGIKTAFAVVVQRFAVFKFRQQLFFFERRIARFNDNVIVIINNVLKVAQSHVEQKTHAARSGLEEPDVRDRNGQLNVSHAFAANAGQTHFNAATVADDPFMLDTFVFSATALPVLGRTEDAFTEKTALFRLKCTVVDRFGVFNLPETPGTNVLRRSQLDAGHVDDRLCLYAENICCIACIHRFLLSKIKYVL